MDILKDMYQRERLSEERWQLVQNVRRLNAVALRSQGIQSRIQNHSRRWGMPYITARDPFSHAQAERCWRYFQALMAHYANHGLVDREMVSVVLYETQQKHMVNQERRVHEALDAIEAAYTKLKKRF